MRSQCPYDATSGLPSGNHAMMGRLRPPSAAAAFSSPASVACFFCPWLPCSLYLVQSTPCAMCLWFYDATCCKLASGLPGTWLGLAVAASSSGAQGTWLFFRDLPIHSCIRAQAKADLGHPGEMQAVSWACGTAGSWAPPGS